MTRQAYIQLAYAHLATVLPSFLIGSHLLLRPKGTAPHKALGRSNACPAQPCAGNKVGLT